MRPIQAMFGRGKSYGANVPEGVYSSNVPSGSTGVVLNFFGAGNWSVDADFDEGGTWKLGSGPSSDYEIRWVPNTGTPAGSPVNSWINLSGGVQWNVVIVSEGEVAADGTVSIRRADTLQVLDSGVIQLIAHSGA